MAKYEVVPATLAHAHEMVPRVRGFERTIDLAASVEKSDEAWTWLVDGEVSSIMGVGRAHDMVVPWLVASKKAESHRMSFVRLARALLYKWVSIYGRLDGFVATDNPFGARWIMWLGCAVSKAVYTGPHGEQFHHFFIENKTP